VFFIGRGEKLFDEPLPEGDNCEVQALEDQSNKIRTECGSLGSCEVRQHHYGASRGCCEKSDGIRHRCRLPVEYDVPKECSAVAVSNLWNALDNSPEQSHPRPKVVLRAKWATTQPL
jgi:hypothetical protein